MTSTMWSPQRQLLLPQRQLLHSLGEIVPMDYVWPTVENYAQQLATGVESIATLSKDDLGITLTPAGQNVAGGLKTALESVTGGPLVDTLINAIVPGAPPLVASMLKNLVNGALDLVLSAVGELVGSVISSAMSVIPIIGQFVGMIVEFLVAWAGGPSQDEKDRALIAAQEECRGRHVQECKAIIEGLKGTWSSLATGADGKNTPADQFRPLAYLLTPDGRRNPLTTGRQLPWSPMSCYVYLCGGEGPPGIGPTRNTYEACRRRVSERTGIKNLGLPLETRRRMWKLITGICAAAQDPNPTAATAIGGEQGKTMYGMLIDMVVRSWEPFATAWKLPTEGVWNTELLREISATESPWVNTHWIADGIEQPSFCYQGPCSQWGDVVGEFNLENGKVGEAGFMLHVANYANSMRQHFVAVDKRGNTKLVGYPAGEGGRRLVSLLGNVKSKAMLVVRDKAAQSGANVILGRQMTASQKAILSAAGLSGGYLAYRGIKAAARMLRTR